MEIVPAEGRGLSDEARQHLLDHGGGNGSSYTPRPRSGRWVGFVRPELREGTVVRVPEGPPPALDGESFWSTLPDNERRADGERRALWAISQSIKSYVIANECTQHFVLTVKVPLERQRLLGRLKEWRARLSPPGSRAVPMLWVVHQSEQRLHAHVAIPAEVHVSAVTVTWQGPPETQMHTRLSKINGHVDPRDCEGRLTPDQDLAQIIDYITKRAFEARRTWPGCKAYGTVREFVPKPIRIDRPTETEVISAMCEAFGGSTWVAASPSDEWIGYHGPPATKFYW